MIPFAINHVHYGLRRVLNQTRFFICNHFPLFQLAHIHIATPDISSMTAIIAFPPAALDSRERCLVLNIHQN